MGELFDRHVQITVGIPSGIATVINAASPKKEPQLRIGYDVKKTVTSALNTAEVRIWNLDDKTRSLIRPLSRRAASGGAPASPSAFVLQAGYEEDLFTVFKGYVTRVTREREGPDLVTIIESNDGYDAVQEAEFKKTYKAGTRVVLVLRDVAESLGIPVVDATGKNIAGIVAGMIERGQPSIIQRAMSLKGKTVEVLDRLAFRWRFDWSIIDGSIQLVAKNRAVAEPAIKITAESGLIGAPSKMALTREVSETVKKKERTFVEVEDGASFECLMIPGLKPGALVDLKSNDVTGVFRCESVNYSGDNYESALMCSVEARSVVVA